MYLLQNEYDFETKILKFHDKLSAQFDELNEQMKQQNNLLGALIRIQEKRLAIEKWTHNIDL